ATSVQATGVGGLDDTNPADFTFSYVGTGTTSYGPSANAPTNAGSYTVTATYNGDANHTGSPSSPTPFTISPATLTIMPNAGVTKVYGAPLPPLPFVVSLSAFGSFPVFSGALGTTAKPSSPVGNYAITLGSLSVDSNYTLTLEANPPTLAVTPAVITVSVHNASRIYGVANPSFTVS